MKAAPVFTALFGVSALAAFTALAVDDKTERSEDGAKAFVDVVKVLQSPRCVNCHPNGDAPKVGDDSHVHAMEVRRGLEKVGMSCQTCHRMTSTATSRAPGAPPAVPGWGLPPADQPMVFEGKSAHDICVSMKDPTKNGGKDAAALKEHVTHEKLVLYGWDPGGKRTLPPLSHDEFVAKFTTWLDAGMPCP